MYKSHTLYKHVLLITLIRAYRYRISAPDQAIRYYVKACWQSVLSRWGLLISQKSCYRVSTKITKCRSYTYCCSLVWNCGYMCIFTVKKRYMPVPARKIEMHAHPALTKLICKKPFVMSRGHAQSLNAERETSIDCTYSSSDESTVWLYGLETQKHF